MPQRQRERRIGREDRQGRCGVGVGDREEMWEGQAGCLVVGGGELGWEGRTCPPGRRRSRRGIVEEGVGGITAMSHPDQTV